ncbi:hypothetical protein VTL71DRAFT_3374 [Oculimacula yallundae]|uniref:Uncharacterized protein n=1 Tax=Oculimacula yallundae TaxID=86028 RepID=A0ABR4C8W5_9HELO
MSGVFVLSLQVTSYITTGRHGRQGWRVPGLKISHNLAANIYHKSVRRTLLEHNSETSPELHRRQDNYLDMSQAFHHILLWILTWPYHYTFLNYTKEPIVRIVRSSSKLNDPEYNANVAAFVAGKRHELRFLKTAATLSAAATVGTLSWPSIAFAPWPALALWYCSLLLAIFALITSNQHSALLDSAIGTTISISRQETGSGPMSELGKNKTFSLPSFLNPEANLPIMGTPAPEIELAHTIGLASIGKSRWSLIKSVYIWQCPLMLMSWSWVTFLVAETLHVARPLLWTSAEHNDRKARGIY